MADLIENDVQIKALNNNSEDELLFPITKAKLIKDLNCFGKIKIGDSGITAVGIDTTLELEAGDGVLVNINNTLKKITIKIDPNYVLGTGSGSLNNTLYFKNYKFDDTIDLKHVLTD